MPTVRRAGPYRLFFYSADGDEPPHIHIEREGKAARFWLDPVRLVTSGGLSRAELRVVGRMISVHESDLLEAWHGFFGH